MIRSPLEGGQAFILPPQRARRVRIIILPNFMLFVSSFENRCKAMVSHNEEVTGFRHTRESGYPG